MLNMEVWKQILLLLTTVITITREARGQFWPGGLSALSGVKVQPKNVLTFVGEEVQIWCNSTNPDVKAKYGIRLENKYVSEKKIPADDIKTVAGGNIFTWLNITEKFVEYENHVQCWNEDSDSLLAEETFYVEKPLQNVTNLTYVFDIKNETLQMSWEQGEVYRSVPGVIETCVKSAVNIDPNHPRAQNSSHPIYVICVDMTQEQSAILEDIGWDASLVFVRLNVTLKLDSNLKRPADFIRSSSSLWASSVVQIIPMDYGKFHKPLGFTVNWSNATCFGLSWNEDTFKHVTGNEFLKYVYRIWAKRIEDNDFLLLADGTGNGNATLCGLYASSEYSIRISMKPEHNGLWSEAAETTGTTSELRPLAGPPVSATSFYSSPCESTKTRRVRIYWASMDKDTARGELSYFNVTIPMYYSQSRRMPIGVNFYEVDLPCDRKFDVFVDAVNKMGSSLNPSVVHIPALQEVLSVPDPGKFEVHIEETNVTREKKNLIVTWTQLRNDWTLILYFCEKSNPMSCFGDLQSVTTNASDGVLSLEDIPFHVNMYGYAFNNDEGSVSGITWTDCVFQRDRKPSQPDLVASIGEEDNSIETSWLDNHCDSIAKALVVKYHVYLCHQLTADPSLCGHYQMIDDPLTTSFLWRGLDNSQKYFAYMQAESTGGKGPFSKAQTAVPLNKALQCIGH